LFNIIGISAGTGFLALLAISTLLRWFSLPDIYPAPYRSTGIHFGDGRFVLLLSLVLGTAVGLNFLSRKFLSLSMVLAGAFGTFSFVVMLAHIGYRPGAGVIIGLIATMGVMGACIWTAVRHPMALEVPGQPTQPAFMRAYGALLGSQTVALVLGLVYWILYAASRPALPALPSV
jgi:hypothetical protein